MIVAELQAAHGGVAGEVGGEEAVADVTVLVGLMKARIALPGITEAERKAAQSSIDKATNASLKLLERRLGVLSRDARASEAKVFVSRGYVDTDRAVTHCPHMRIRGRGVWPRSAC